MRHRIIQKVLDAPSVWCIRLLCALSLIVTCALAFAHSPRTAWAVIASVSLLLLSAVNRLRIHSRVKRLSGIARRPKRERAGRSKHAEE
ncbi:MAG: hypothetical protein FWD25_01795 [Clostridia bacterium]|nr:hypothetical protein [Clostridia bacterium]